MPCNTIVRSKVEFLATSTDKNLLASALNALGLTATVHEGGVTFEGGYRRSGSYDSATGKLTAWQGLDTEAVKRGYSEAVVNATAKKNGWQVSWSTNAAGNREASVLRREY